MESKTNDNKPVVSVLITVFNADQHLATTLDALLSQSYSNYEIIIVDDGSTDRSVPIIESYEREYENIHLWCQGKIGRAKALNFGLKKCEGELIAVNDADDISLPERIQRQVLFLDSNPEYVLVGSKMRIHDLSSGQSLEYSDCSRPLEDEDIRSFFLRGQPIQHSSAMMRKEAIEKVGGYNENMAFLLDRDLFIRISQVGLLCNLDEYLISLGRGKKQFFRSTFKGRERVKMDFRYRMYAANLFNASKAQKLNLYLLRYWTLIRLSLKYMLNNGD